MKLLCISVKMPGRLDHYVNYFTNIEIGKIYNGKEYGDVHYLVTDDSGKECLYMRYNFENIEKIRDIKLKELGI
jgi:hypothetical protein